MACNDAYMSKNLLDEITELLNETGMPEYRFGWKAVHNGRLIERVRSGRRLWPETEARVRAFIAEERRRIDGDRS